MKLWQILSFGFGVYRRFSSQKIGKGTYKSLARAIRFGCSSQEWTQLGHELGIIQSD